MCAGAYPGGEQETTHAMYDTGATDTMMSEMFITWVLTEGTNKDIERMIHAMDKSKVADDDCYQKAVTDDESLKMRLAADTAGQKDVAMAVDEEMATTT